MILFKLLATVVILLLPVIAVGAASVGNNSLQRLCYWGVGILGCLAVVILVTIVWTGFGG